MKLQRTGSRKGFSLVELLAVVLVLAVLAAVAIPLYTSQRRSAAGRACKANLAAIASSMAGFALRTNAYPTTLVALVGTAEGLAELPKCPLGGNGAGGAADGTYTYALGVSPVATTVTCPNSAAHVGFGGLVAAEWIKTLAAPAADNLP